jgi:subtilase family serine protease
LKPATWPLRFGAGGVLAVGTAGAMLTLSAVAPAGAATTPPNKVVVPQAITVKGLHASRISAAAASTKETVSFVLKTRNTAKLEADVEAGMPSGYLSVSKFANYYGQSQANVSALEAYLKTFGIKSSAYRDRLNISTTGTVADYNKALDVSQSMYRAAATAAHGTTAAQPAQVFHGTTNNATLPASLARFVYSVLGLTSYATNASEAQHSLLRQPSGAHAVQLGNRTPADFAKQYGLDPLYTKGAKGQGETIGIITYASVRPSDATHFWTSILKIKTKANRITLDNIDGGSGPVKDALGSGETTLDLEQSGALAPDASIIVYQAPNTDYGSADAWFGAASSNVAATISTSWGESEFVNEAIAEEGIESPTYGGIFNEAGLEMAAQGQSAFDAAGDSGAYDDAPAYTDLDVDNPADSPYLTAGGGTTIAGQIPLVGSNDEVDATVNITAQRAWAWDYLWPYYNVLAYISGDTTEGAFAADPNFAAGGGGGYSMVNPRPAYQSRIASISDSTTIPYLTPENYVLYGTSTACDPTTSTQVCLPTEWNPWATGTGITPPPATEASSNPSGRAVPDISADADPDTGYEEYYIDFPKAYGHLEDGWGGTSFVAPQLNGSAAVIDSYLGHRSGFWNPAIYQFATRSWTPFTPLNAAGASNDNLYYTGSGKSTSVYNAATGLGVPNLNKLALDFKYHA